MVRQHRVVGLYSYGQGTWSCGTVQLWSGNTELWDDVQLWSGNTELREDSCDDVQLWSGNTEMWDDVQL